MFTITFNTRNSVVEFMGFPVVEVTCSLLKGYVKGGVYEAP